jgi:hypothetical protein
VLERETGLEDIVESGIMIHGDVSADLLVTIFTPKSPLHDGAVIVRDDRIVAAGALLPLAEMSIHTERFGTRHRAALGITEQTDAVVVVVSEENGQISLVERARIVRNLTEAGLARAIQGLLDPQGGRRGALVWASASATQARGLAGRSPRLRELGRFVGRPSSRREPAAATAGLGGVTTAGPVVPPVAHPPIPTGGPPVANASNDAHSPSTSADLPETETSAGSNGVVTRDPALPAADDDAVAPAAARARR